MAKPKLALNPDAPVLRDELKILKKVESGIRRELTAAEKRWHREQQAVKVARRNVAHTLKRIARRRAILNGRLAA